MGRIKFEKINMKIVAAVAVAIILILTVIFIVINTGKGDKGKDSNTNTNTNPVEGPIISEEAKDRTKDLDKLNSAEKKYIIEQNFLEYLKNLNPEKYQELIEKCVEGQECTISIEDFLDYIEDPENPTNPDDPNNPEDNMLKIEDCNGNISYVYNNGEFKVDMSGVTCKGPNIGGDDSNSNTNTNTNIVDPDGDSNDNEFNGDGMAESVRVRTKPASSLSETEKKYIVLENIMDDINQGEQKILNQYAKICINATDCDMAADDFKDYSDNDTVGYNLKGCSGNAYITYVPGYSIVERAGSNSVKVVADNVKPSVNEIRIGDVVANLSVNPAKVGEYVVKKKTTVYVKATSKTKGAIKVVADNTEKMNANEIKISSVYPRVNLTPFPVPNPTLTPEVSIENLKAGDYIVKRTFEGYIKAKKDTKNALKVVADTKKLEAHEISLYNVKPYLSTQNVKVGDYVNPTFGHFIIESSGISCKRG